MPASMFEKHRKALGSSRNILLIFVSLAILMITSALIELFQSKKELYKLMEDNAHSLFESLLISSENALKTYNYLEQLTRQRVLNQATIVIRLYENGKIDDPILDSLVGTSNIAGIHIFDTDGKIRYSASDSASVFFKEGSDIKTWLNPLFSGIQDTLILGFQPSRVKNVYHYLVALKARDNAAILFSERAGLMSAFRRQIGFGNLLRKLAEDNDNIIYASLQDTSNILAASGNVEALDAIPQSDFLKKAWQDSLFLTRTTTFDTLDIFEAVHPFSFKGRKIGLFRIGISTEIIDDINARIYRRLIIITLILIIIGSVMLTFIFTRQQFHLLQKRYEVIESYSSGIIENVSDAIIVLDSASGIKIFNSAAEQLLGVDRENIKGHTLNNLFRQSDCRTVFQDDATLNQIECTLKGRKKYLLISRSRFKDRDGIENTIMVIRDLTEQKQLEAQIEREQRLSAMGELASGVAHEIRNPLNTIATIIQQLNKDFEPVDMKEEYHELAQLVHTEVKRINKTVQDFLSFARPSPVAPSTFYLSDFLNDIELQYRSMMQQHNISFEKHLDWDGEVYWDRQQMKQVYLNLMQNAIDAIGSDGHIYVSVLREDARAVNIDFADDGPGMDDTTQKRIFNLYYTSKPNGTGIGLSLVQRIVYEHGGLINVESRKGHGSRFILRMPVTYVRD